MPRHHQPTRRRIATGIRIGLGLVAASTLLGVNTPVTAEAAPAAPVLGGFTGSAGSSALHVEYNPKGLLPTASILDLNAPDALATIASGPSTFARAGVADPGDLLANPDALFAQASTEYPQGLIPPWPFRITAGSGAGAPEAESSPAPGLHARVTAKGGSSTAEATAPGLDLPAVVSIGSLASYADTTTDGSSVKVHARSEISRLNILGLIQIKSIITDLTATSTGTETTVSGGTVVTGASLAGTPVEIDDDQVRAAGIDLSAILEPLGITITLPGPSEVEVANAGQLASNGLRVEIRASASTAPVISDILNALPPIEPIIPGAPSPEDLLAIARANHITTIEFGRGSVSIAARTPTQRAPATAAPSSPGSSSPAATRPAPSFTSPAAPQTPPAALAPVATAANPGSPGFAALAALLLILQPFIGDRLARFADLQLATDQDACPWERS